MANRTPEKLQTVTIPPLTPEFDRELRCLDSRAAVACRRASEAHLADLRREGKPLQSLQFVERY